MVPITSGTEPGEAVLIVDILRYAGISVVIASDNNITTCERNIKIIPEKTFHDIEEEHFDAIIIPGGMQGVSLLSSCLSFREILTEHYRNGGIIGAVCAAPTLLVDWKLYEKDTIFTSHPDVKKGFPQDRYSTLSPTVSGRIITGGGLGTVCEFAVKMVEILTDRDTAIAVADSISL